MSGHTPGPWAVVDGHYPSMKEISGPSFKINIVMSATDLDFNDCLKRSADAQLIAAAPELLDDLVEAARTLRRYEVLHRAKSTADSLEKAEVNAEIASRFEATIAKAKGETK